jgi:hypothetical protein
MLLFGVSLSLNGCTEFLKSPMEMIKRPKLEVNQERALEVIQQAIGPNAKLISPLISDELSSVNMIDMDNDDVKEVVAFYSLKDSFRIGFVILERSAEGFYVAYKQEDIGNDLIYARIDDLSGRGRYSLILGLQGAEGTLKNLSVYSYSNGSYSQSYKSEYSEVLMDDFDSDGRNEIFILSYNRDKVSTASIIKENKGTMSVMDIQSLDPNIKAYSHIQFGQIARGKGAIILDFSLGSELAATEVLLIDGLKLKSLFHQQNSVMKYEKTLKSKLVVSQDIDGDGIIEIGKPLMPPTAEDPITLQVSQLTGWYKWDGKQGLSLLRITYDDPKGMYRFSLPSRWKMDVSVYNNTEFDELQTVRFRIELEPKLAFDLFEIVTVPSEQFNDFRESLNNRNIVYYLLERSEGQAFVGLYEASNRNVPEEYLTRYRNLTLTDSEIRENFKLFKH